MFYKEIFIRKNGKNITRKSPKINDLKKKYIYIKVFFVPGERTFFVVNGGSEV